jgi:hypothetical protein
MLMLIKSRAKTVPQTETCGLHNGYSIARRSTQSSTHSTISKLIQVERFPGLLIRGSGAGREEIRGPFNARACPLSTCSSTDQIRPLTDGSDRPRDTRVAINASSNPHVYVYARSIELAMRARH